MKKFTYLLLVNALLPCVYAQQKETKPVPVVFQNDTFQTTRQTVLKKPMPPYQIPKGNIFCRMEDVVSRKTGVWLRVGTTDKIGR